MFSNDFIAVLKENNPIESVMGSYVSLTRRGRGYVCLCPFHSENSPSCTVYPENNSFYCFGCGAGGDVITFIRQIESLDYPEAVKFLAERAGLALPQDAGNSQAAHMKTRILELNRNAARFYYGLLREKAGEKGLRYFASRGVSPLIVKKYGLGYSPGGWDGLSKAMRAKGFTEAELLAAGLCKQGPRGGIYDVFRDRAMFPILDLRGNVVGFGGRVIDGEGPKYLNSPDTPVFKKSRNLFSLHLAKASAVKEQRLILAEGYMDVLAVHQAGFENVVATLGTALTSEQARLMAQYAKEVILAYDSDGPGQSATHRAINLLGEAGITARIIQMDGAKDPDEYIKKYGPGRFKLLLDKSGGAIPFELEKCKQGLDMESDAGRVEYCKRAVGVLSEITSPIERDVYLSRLSLEQSVSKEVLKSQVEARIRKRAGADKKKQWQSITSQAVRRDPLTPEAARYPREVKAENGLLTYLLLHPEELAYLAGDHGLKPGELVTSFGQRVYGLMLERAAGSPDFTFSSLGDVLTVEEMGKLSQMTAKSHGIALTRREAGDFIQILREKSEAVPPGQELTDEDLNRLREKLRERQMRKENQKNQ